jgi:hypothetical protein
LGYWKISSDVLAGSRFVLSPLAETVACLVALLGRYPAAAGQRDWLAAHRPAFRDRLAGDPFAGPFLAVALRPRWIADLLCRPPHAADETFEQELRRIRDTPDPRARAEVAEGLDRPLPDVLLEPGLAARVADLLEWVWTHTLRPDWPRRRRVFEADIVSRTQRLGTGGWAAVLDGMRPGMRWLGDGRLQINAYDYPPRDITGTQLLFIPTSAQRGWVAWEEPPLVHAIMYPCTGWLAEAPGPPPEALARLLGPVRGRVLALLDAPKSTTQLVALTGHGLGSIGGHLRILHDARLVGRRRAGRSVLYYRTATGDRLVAGCHPGGPADAPAVD